MSSFLGTTDLNPRSLLCISYIINTVFLFSLLMVILPLVKLSLPTVRNSRNSVGTGRKKNEPLSRISPIWKCHNCPGVPWASVRREPVLLSLSCLDLNSITCHSYGRNRRGLRYDRAAVPLNRANVPRTRCLSWEEKTTACFLLFIYRLCYGD